MAGPGTGSPLTFRCAKCKVGRDWRNHDHAGENVEATGRVKPLTPRQFGVGRGIRSLRYRAEYRCLDCGHVGWSSHETMKGLLRQAGYEVVFDDQGYPMAQRVMSMGTSRIPTSPVDSARSGCMVFREDAVDYDCDGWVSDDDEWFPGVGGIIDSENM